jgi:hypothetical protein
MQLVAEVTDESQDIDESDIDLYHSFLTSFESFASRNLPPTATADGEPEKRRQGRPRKVSFQHLSTRIDAETLFHHPRTNSQCPLLPSLTPSLIRTL